WGAKPPRREKASSGADVRAPPPGSSHSQEDATGFLSPPSPSILPSTTSPSLRSLPVALPTPAGVPVAMTSPGSRVIRALHQEIVRAIERIISLVDASR